MKKRILALVFASTLVLSSISVQAAQYNHQVIDTADNLGMKYPKEGYAIVMKQNKNMWAEAQYETALINEDVTYGYNKKGKCEAYVNNGVWHDTKTQKEKGKSVQADVTHVTKDITYRFRYD